MCDEWQGDILLLNNWPSKKALNWRLSLFGEGGEGVASLGEICKDWNGSTIMLMTLIEHCIGFLSKLPKRLRHQPWLWQRRWSAIYTLSRFPSWDKELLSSSFNISTVFVKRKRCWSGFVQIRLLKAIKAERSPNDSEVLTVWPWQRGSWTALKEKHGLSLSVVFSGPPAAFMDRICSWSSSPLPQVGHQWLVIQTTFSYKIRTKNGMMQWNNCVLSES